MYIDENLKKSIVCFKEKIRLKSSDIDFLLSTLDRAEKKMIFKRLQKEKEEKSDTIIQESSIELLNYASKVWDRKLRQNERNLKPFVRLLNEKYTIEEIKMAIDKYGQIANRIRGFKRNYLCPQSLFRNFGKYSPC